MKAFRIGTRGSPLALAQTNIVKGDLERLWPSIQFELVTIRTRGDDLSAASPDSKLPVMPGDVGTKGLFTGELEAALHSGDIQLAVHSLKDLPTNAEMDVELEIAAIPSREDPRDVMITRANEIPLKDLSGAPIIATSSPRRAAQLLLANPQIKIVPVRGNIDTRVRKFRENLDWYALVLASAGIHRLETDKSSQAFAHIHRHILLPEVMLPAPGQGALALQTKRGNQEVRRILAPLHHAESAAEVAAERAFLRALGGGCQQPIAALGRALPDGKLTLTGISWLGLAAGEIPTRVSMEGSIAQPVELGEALALKLIR